MKRYRVTITPTALRQIQDQVLHIAENSSERAQAWETRLLDAMDSLGEVRGYAIDEYASERLGRTIRKFVFEKTYLIHFVVDDDGEVVRVVNFRHGMRLPRIGEP